MKRILKMKPLAAALVGATIAGPIEAHEFWIDTDLSRLPADRHIAAHIRVGEDLSGPSLPYVDRTIREMRLVTPTMSRAIDARLGDRPAIDGVTLQETGLHALVVETNPSYIVFRDMPEFEVYLGYEGLSDIADAHRARGLQEVEIAEEYIRNARALIQLGEVRASDVDRSSGLPFEIVVEGTPFMSWREKLRVQLTWNGRAVPDAQIAMFHLPPGLVAPEGATRKTIRTDHTGYAEFPMMGAGQYMLNAVRLDPVQGPGSVIWQSHWASLTFEIETVQ